MYTLLTTTAQCLTVAMVVLTFVAPAPSAAQDALELIPANLSTPSVEALPAGETLAFEEIGPPGSSEINVLPVAKLDVDVSRRARKLFGHSPLVDVAMVTQNPADGCFYEIPLCLPACCTGEPKVHSYCGLLGRGVVVYSYDCGLAVEVKFRLRGDVEVEYGT